MPIGAMGTAGQQAFALLRRLREELKVNTTCGASNVSFGLPNRHVVTGTFLSMAIASGMTSAIMNPMHAEVKTAVMAADVLMGTDRDCAAWIRANRDPNAPTGEGGRRPRGPAPAARRVSRARGDHRVVFTPSGLTGTVDTARPCSTRRAGSAPTSTRCAVGVASAAGARSRRRRFVRQVGDHGRPEALGPGLDRDRLPGPARCSTRSSARVRGDRARRRRRRRPAVEPGPPPGRAQGSRPSPIVVDPSFTLCYVELPKAELGDEDGRRSICRRPSRNTAATPDRSVRRARLAAAGDRSRRRARHRGDRRRDRIVRVWPGFVDGATASPSTSARPRSPGTCAT